MLCAAIITSGGLIAFAEGETEENQPDLQQVDQGYGVSETVTAAVAALENLPELDSLSEQTDADALLAQVKEARNAVEALTEEEKAALCEDAADLMNKLDELEFFFANRPVTAPEDVVTESLNEVDTTEEKEASVQEVDTAEELQSAVENGGYIKLTSNIENVTTDQMVTIPSGKTVFLDLNGKNITVNADFVGRPIVNEGTLTVNGNGRIDSSNGNKGYGAIANKGTLTVNSGTFAGNPQGNGTCIKNFEGANLTINGGTFEKATGCLYNEGKAVINGGSFTSTSCNGCGVWSYTINNVGGDLTIYNATVSGVHGALAAAGGTTTVYSGTFETKPCEKHPDGSTAFYALYVSGNADESTCHIYGGTFKSASKVAVYVGNSTPGDGGICADATAYLHGGTFQSGTDKVIGGNATSENPTVGSLEITGGNYTDKNGDRAEDVVNYFPNNGGYELDENGTVIAPNIPNDPSTPTTPNNPSTGGSSTVQQMEEREKPDPADKKAVEAYNFWKEVKAKIRSAKDGKMLKISVVQSAEYMPASVMQTLYERENVGLTLYWNKDTIVIPAGKAMPKQPMKAYWTVKKLTELY